MKNFILFASLTAFITGATAEMKWNLATAYPKGRFQTENVEFFANKVAEATNGELKITVHPGQSLYKSNEIFPRVSHNQVEMGEVLMSKLEKYNVIFSVDNLPFIATDYEDASKLWKASREIIATELDKKGVKLLYAVPWPGQNFYSKGIIEDASFFEGKKLRTYSNTLKKIAESLGAEAVAVKQTEISEAFSNNKIDAMMTSGALGVFTKSWEYAKYYTQVNAFYPKNMVFVNNEQWESLPPAIQEKVLEVAAQAEKRGWELSKKTVIEKEAILSKNGMQLVNPTKAFKQSLFTLGQRISKDWHEKAGEQGKQILKNYRNY